MSDFMETMVGGGAVVVSSFGNCRRRAVTRADFWITGFIGLGIVVASGPL